MTTGRVAAYTERAIMDPITGEDGTLREEWRILSFSNYDQSRLVAAFGSNWRTYKPFPVTILEQRYIRRGIEEPWRPTGIYGSDDMAISDIDLHAVAVNTGLIKLQGQRRESDRRKTEDQERAAQADQEQQALQASRAASSKAFQRLLDGKSSQWGHKWNALVRSIQNDDRRLEKLRQDSAFRKLYAAVLDSTTVPSKRKAIKAAIEYVRKGETWDAGTEEYAFKVVSS